MKIRRSDVLKVLTAVCEIAVAASGVLAAIDSFLNRNEDQTEKLSTNSNRYGCLNNCDWICDYCGAYMNDQPGFTTITGTWTCSNCGALNDVTDYNVVSEKTNEFELHGPLREPDDEDVRSIYGDYEGFDPEDL